MLGDHAWPEELPLDGLVCGRDDSMALSRNRSASLRGEPAARCREPPLPGVMSEEELTGSIGACTAASRGYRLHH